MRSLRPLPKQRSGRYGHELRVDAGGCVEAGFIGDILVAGFMARGGVGIVCDGAVRDLSYLRTLAVARVMLDNFPNVQASWVTQGGKIGQVSLRFGANDFGSLMIEENVVSAAGAHFRLTEAEIARNIMDAGFVPKRRTMHYEIVGDPYCWSHAIPDMPVQQTAATSLAG